MMRLIFARHGQSEANVLRLMSNRAEPAHGLTALGREQAAALAEAIAARQPSALYCSPLLRAVQTAEIVGTACGLKAEQVDALREPDCGELEGRGDPEAWAIHDAAVAAWLAGDAEARPPGGESLKEVRARFLPFIDGLVGAWRTLPVTIALVAHGSLLANMLPELCVNLPRDAALRFGMPNAQPIHVDVGPRGLVCASWAGMTPGP